MQQKTKQLGIRHIRVADSCIFLQNTTGDQPPAAAGLGGQQAAAAGAEPRGHGVGGRPGDVDLLLPRTAAACPVDRRQSGHWRQEGQPHDGAPVMAHGDTSNFNVPCTIR